MNLHMRALRKFPGAYMGRAIDKGEEFTAASERDARVFSAIGHAVRLEQTASHYVTRVMTASTRQEPAATSLDAMSLDELRAEAARLGLKVHHKAGVAKLREAIREAS